MDDPGLPEQLLALQEVIEPCLQRVYALNARRHDELAGDDSVTFGITVYRNSWYHIEQDIAELDGWTSARPDGSLVVSGHGYSVHFYRFGDDERVDLNQFRFDDPTASLTKQHIAANNQLILNFGQGEDPQEADPQLRNLVVLHAGNPDEGCCGIWLGAPLPSVKVLGVPWGWIRPLWVIERAPEEETTSQPEPITRHEQLEAPPVPVTPLRQRPSKTGDSEE